MTFAYYTLLTLLIFVALLLILLILIQKGRGGGLSSAFGGSGGSTAFGAKTGDVLTWATSTVFGIFIVLAVVLDLVVNSQYKSTAPVVNAAGNAPVVPISNPVPDTTPPPAAPAPVEVPALPPVTTTPVAQLKQFMQNAATQTVHDAKTTTQP